jgi:putative colanic acid biosynthesis UDP-glucose lipid carrier transferase
MFILLAVLNFLWYFASNVTGFYEDSRHRSFSYQFINASKIVLVQVITAILFIFIAKEDLFTRNFILFHAFFLILFVSIRIQAIRFLTVRLGQRENKLQNIVIVGAGEVAKNFYNTTLKNRWIGYSFAGYLDDVYGENLSNDIIGKIDDLDNIIETKNINEVIVALPISAFSRLDQIIRVCNRHAVQVHIIPDYFQFVSKKFRIGMFENFPIITVRDEPLAEPHWRFIKRLFDILFSTAIIFLFLIWLIPLIAILVKLFSKGTVFYAQKRLGMRNKIFKFYKFRTLIEQDKSKEERFLPITADDSRITSIGRFLRKTNLDELPQFFNILKGDMSVVGPRPHFIPYDEVYSEIVDEIKLRSRVRPGLTGWAQVHGLRGDSPDPIENEIRTKKRIEYDIWYIENWSIWLDLQIIILTIWQMLRGETKAV